MYTVHLAGRKQQPKGYRNALVDYSQLMVIVVTGGSLQVACDGREERIEGGRFLVLPPGVTVTLSCQREGYRGFFLEGRPEEAGGLPRRVGIHRLPAAMRSMLDLLEAELGADEDEDLAPSWYAILLNHALRLHRGAAAVAPPDDLALCRMVERRLRASLHSGGRLDAILAGLPLGQRQILRRWRRQRGESLKSSQLRLRLEEAGRALRDRGRSITDVAIELGFPSSQHFATMFRRRHGLAPGAWRHAQGQR